MKIIITGGAGFIGSHLVNKLLLENNIIHVIDNLSSGKVQNLPLDKNLTLHQVDILNKYYLSKIFSLTAPDVVYHLAAQIDVRKSITRPEFDANINIIGTLNILEECKKYNSKIIFSSSGGAIYQDNDEPIKTENSVIGPASPYGISKLAGENYVNFYNKIYNLDSTILRFSNVYGPRQGGGECGVLAIFIDNALKNKASNIFGTGEQVRDYVYVEDVVNALILARDISGTYNVSTGKDTTVNYLAEKIQKEFNCQFNYAPKIEGELFRNCLSSKKLQNYGWRPTTEINEGINKTIQWFKEEK